jgi:hypothetical protein
MSFQKIVEELHVKLIVFDDENFLGHTLFRASACGTTSVYITQVC